MAMESLVYNSHGKKYAVPRQRVFSIYELGRGDHIAFHRNAGLYWHHAIVEYVDYSNNWIDVIHYTNTAKGFMRDNSSSPKRPGIARVVQQSLKFEEEVIYLMKHKWCLDPETVVWNARNIMIEDEGYNPFTNNCEHFAMRCKTGISSSDQVDKAGEMIVSNGKKQCASGAGQRIAERRAGHAFVQRARVPTNQIFTRSTPTAGQAVVGGGLRVATAQSASTAGKVFVRGGVRVAANQGLTQTSTAAAGVVGGAAIGTAIEGISVIHDIDCAHDDMIAGRISRRHFEDVAAKRIFTGTTNAVGSVAGMLAGQALIPVPILGGVIGGIAGGIFGSLFGNTLVNL